MYLVTSEYGVKLNHLGAVHYNMPCSFCWMESNHDLLEI